MTKFELLLKLVPAAGLLSYCFTHLLMFLFLPSTLLAIVSLEMIVRPCVSLNIKHFPVSEYFYKPWNYAQAQTAVREFLITGASQLEDAELEFIKHVCAFLALDRSVQHNALVLSIQQLFRISTMYWDDKHSTHGVSSDVI
ncbi:hypothetical protein MKW98_013521 [Papaver atlanticum]|uniref:Uncharacterized protein n=1 Tax=Papaver atlanticum TaxID=357466 RepID=A0AAD4XKJ8_9MAGN|nr:hypothetical protein MKW98_013521 [Papaver atlanticum]